MKRTLFWEKLEGSLMQKAAPMPLVALQLAAPKKDISSHPAGCFFPAGWGRGSSRVGGWRF
jgi:hypothetical protein